MKTCRVVMRMTPAERAALERCSAQLGQTKTEYIMQALRRNLAFRVALKDNSAQQS